MKIAICGSMFASSKIIKIKKELEELGHEVIIPRNTESFASGSISPETGEESTANKIEGNLIQEYFKIIEASDAVLAINIDKNGIKNYIGSNTFLEIGFGHVLDKKVFLLNDVPEISCKDEILAMQPIIINGDLSKII